MKTRLVYRMENETGHGAFQLVDPDEWNDAHPFTAGKSPDADDPAKRLSQAEYDRIFPVPWDDPRLAVIGAERPEIFDWECGCCSREQLATWFPEPTEPLLDTGGAQFTVWRVSDDRVAEGDTQAMFDREDAECIERSPVAALYRQLRREAA